MDDAQIRELMALAQIPTDSIDAGISTAFSLKMEHLRQLEAIAVQRQALLDSAEDMHKQITAIALFLRNNYQSEIARGLHDNRSVSDVVTTYLTRERRWRQRLRIFMPWL